jgi:hypothetical protein
LGVRGAAVRRAARVPRRLPPFTDGRIRLATRLLPTNTARSAAWRTSDADRVRCKTAFYHPRTRGRQVSCRLASKVVTGMPFYRLRRSIFSKRRWKPPCEIHPGCPGPDRPAIAWHRHCQGIRLPPVRAQTEATPLLTAPRVQGAVALDAFVPARLSSPRLSPARVARSPPGPSTPWSLCRPSAEKVRDALCEPGEFSKRPSASSASPSYRDAILSSIFFNAAAAAWQMTSLSS